MADGYLKIGDLPPRGPGNCARCGGLTPNYNRAALVGFHRGGGEPFRLCDGACARPVAGPNAANIVRALEELLHTASDAGHPAGRVALRQALTDSLPAFLATVAGAVVGAVRQARPDLDEDDVPGLVDALAGPIAQAVLDVVLPAPPPGGYDLDGQPYSPPVYEPMPSEFVISRTPVVRNR